MESKSLYIHPESEIVEMDVKGMICQSPEAIDYTLDPSFNGFNNEENW